MTKLEEQLVTKMISDSTIKFYIRYVDGTFVLLKRSDVNQDLNKLNSFHKNLRFTVDTQFLGHKVHFLDLLINKNLTDLYYKETHTGRGYSKFFSFTPWRLNTAWAKSFVLQSVQNWQ